MKHNRQNFLLFLTIFCTFTLITQKIRISKKWKKKHLEKSSFYTSVPKIMIICYTVPDIWCMADVIVNFYFGLFFVFSPPLLPCYAFEENLFFSATKILWKKVILSCLKWTWKHPIKITWYICKRTFF